MKKRNILIAVIAVAAMASMVKAEEIKVDFDGGKLKSFSVAEIAENSDMKIPVPERAVSVPGDVTYENELDRSIKGTIRAVRSAGEFSVARKLEILLAKGSLEQKREFVTWKEGVYRFPKALFPGGTEKGACRWVTSTVCEWSCDFAAANETQAGKCKNECRKILVEACD